MLGNVGNSAYEIERAVQGPAHDKAFRECIEEAKPNFRPMSRSVRTGPVGHLLERKVANVVLRIALRTSHTELASAQVQATVDQMQQKVQQQDLTKDLNLTAEGSVLCPGCGARTQGAKFCPECGKPLHVKAGCSRCGTAVEAGANSVPSAATRWRSAASMPTYAGNFFIPAIPFAKDRANFPSRRRRARCPAAPPSLFDLGDVDIVVRNPWDLELTLFTGRHLTLSQFGAAFDRMAGEFIAAWRDRSIHCLMLEDLEPAGLLHRSRRPCAGSSHVPPRSACSRAIRDPAACRDPYQWRLAEVDAIGFSSETYAVTLRAGDRSMVIGKLAKKTDEFRETLQEQYSALPAAIG